MSDSISSVPNPFEEQLSGVELATDELLVNVENLATYVYNRAMAGDSLNDLQPTTDRDSNTVSYEHSDTGRQSSSFRIQMDSNDIVLHYDRGRLQVGGGIINEQSTLTLFSAGNAHYTAIETCATFPPKVLVDTNEIPADPVNELYKMLKIVTSPEAKLATRADKPQRISRILHKLRLTA